VDQASRQKEASVINQVESMICDVKEDQPSSPMNDPEKGSI